MLKDSNLIDTQVWGLGLIIQAVPYTAPVVASPISGLPRLPAKLVGLMAPLKGVGNG